MKILFITNYALGYGANKSMLVLMRDLRARYKIEPIVLMPEEGIFCKFLAEEDITYYVNPFLRWMTTKRKKYFGLFFGIMNLFYYNRIYHSLKNMKIDLIHSNTSVTNIGSYLSKYLKVPHIWHLREFGLEDYGLYYYYPEKFVQREFSKAYCLIAISRAIETSYRKFLKCGHILLVYNGIEFNKIKYEKQYKKNSVEFCVIGLIQKRKNQLEAVKACQILKNKGITNFRLHLIGDGDPIYIKTMENFIISNNLQDIVLLRGYQKDVNKLLKDMDVGIVTSEKEAFGRVTIECMGDNLPVIATDTGANSELIEDGKTGFLYPLHNIEVLAEKMYLFIKNPNLINVMGGDAFEYARKNYDYKLNTDKIYSIYIQALRYKE